MPFIGNRSVRYALMVWYVASVRYALMVWYVAPLPHKLRVQS